MQLILPVRKLTFGPYDFKVETLAEDHDAFGYCDYNTHTIKLKEHWANKKQAAETSLHECLHAIFYAAGYCGDDKQEESLVTRTSLTTASFIRDNQVYMRWLVKALAP